MAMTGDADPTRPDGRALALAGHRTDPEVTEAMRAAHRAVLECGATLTFASHEAGGAFMPEADVLRRTDVVLVFGGDGSVVRALNRTVGTGTSVLGVDFGTLAFLAGADASDLELAVRDAASGALTHLPVATATVADPSGAEHVATNDIVLTGTQPGVPITLAPSLDDIEWSGVSCDGLVAATPLGSTAYNLAAGGPVLGLGTNALATTLIAPHTLGARSFVLPTGHVLTVRNVSRHHDDVCLHVDGDRVARPIRTGERVVIRQGTEHAALAVRPGVSLVARFRDLFTSVPVARRVHH